MLEEVGAYQYKKNKEYEQQTPGDGSTRPGLRPEFEEDFSFGEEDDTDYLNFKRDWFALLETDPD